MNHFLLKKQGKVIVFEKIKKKKRKKSRPRYNIALKIMLVQDRSELITFTEMKNKLIPKS